MKARQTVYFVNVWVAGGLVMQGSDRHQVCLQARSGLRCVWKWKVLIALDFQLIPHSFFSDMMENTQTDEGFDFGLLHAKFFVYECRLKKLKIKNTHEVKKNAFWFDYLFFSRGKFGRFFPLWTAAVAACYPTYKIRVSQPWRCKIEISFYFILTNWILHLKLL